MRGRTIFVSLLLFLAIVIVVPAGAQVLPSNGDAKEILDRVFIAMNLRKPGSPPFHLLAHVRYEVDGKSEDGTYEMLWSGSLHYREIFKLAGAEEVRVALDDKMYVSRTSTAITLPVRNVRELIQSPVPGDLMVDLDIGEVATEQVEGQSRMCVHVTKSDANTKQHATEMFCFDSQTKEITSISAEGNLDNKPMKVQLASFKSLGVKRYPMQITSFVHFANMFPANMDVTVDTLENVTKFDGDPFVPPPGSTVRDWCPTLSEALSLEDSSRPRFTQAEIKNLSPFFVLVGADGRVKQADPVRQSTDTKNEEKIKSWLITARFPIQNCGNLGRRIRNVLHAGSEDKLLALCILLRFINALRKEAPRCGLLFLIIVPKLK